MADQFSKMYDFERVGGDQRTRLAEMLRANALNQPQGQMVSGWYVKPSITQQLNPALSGALGVYMGAQLDEERKAKTAELLRDLSQGKAVEPIPAVQNFNGMEQNAQQTPIPQQAPQNELERITQRRTSTEQSMPSPAMMPQQQQRYVPLTEEEKIGKVMELAQYNPYAASIWSAQDTARQARLGRAEERAIDREFKRENLFLQQQGQENLARLHGAIAAGNRAERNLTIMGPEGEPITMPQSQVPPGSQLYTPAAAKALKEQISQFNAKKDVNTQIQDLRNSYDTLNKNFGITSEQNLPGSNLGAWASSTPVGQWLGRVRGTENATARDDIRMARPGLMQSIVKASGMSAKQIDSNAELKLMLDQATDPQAGYEANIKALNRLQSRFGLDGSAPAPTAGMPSMDAIDAEIAARKQRGQGR